MSSKETILTAEGLKKLEDELENLRSVKRHEVAERIKVAIGYGDISENSEYDDAKNDQAFIVGTTEADPSKNRISNESPVGAAILGQKVNSVVQVHTPAGELSYQILEVK